MTSQDLEEFRNSQERVLGRDSAWATLKHNTIKVLACDMQSRGFYWLAAAWITALAIEIYALQMNRQLSDWMHLGLGAHTFLAGLHWAARAEFKKVIDAGAELIANWKGKPSTKDGE